MLPYLVGLPSFPVKEKVTFYMDDYGIVTKVL